MTPIVPRQWVSWPAPAAAEVTSGHREGVHSRFPAATTAAAARPGYIWVNCQVQCPGILRHPPPSPLRQQASTYRHTNTVSGLL